MHIKVMSKQEFSKYLKNSKIYYFFYKTNFGTLTILATNEGIFEASFDNIEIKKEYIKGNIQIKNLILVGTDFQIKVWKFVLQVPSGETQTYQQIAKQIGNANSYRAVANALAQNKIAYFIPCHRIVRKNNAISGYKWGIKRKEMLLEKELLQR